MSLKDRTTRLLIVAYTFPPIPYSGTYRTLRLCKGLDKLGVKLHVLTINQYNDIPNDYVLLTKIPKSVAVYRTPIIDPWRRYQVFKKKYERIKGFRYINKVISLALRFITIPDHMVMWVPFAVFKGIKIIKDQKIDMVYVSSPPNSSQLVGYFLKKFTKVKYVSDFRDPIVGNIAEVNLLNPSDLLSRIERRIRVSFEKVIVNNAYKVVANTVTHSNELAKRFKKDKIHTIRNCFDEDDYKGLDNERYKKFTIAHLGSMYGLRKTDVLFKAIKKLEIEYSPESLNLQVLFVGMNAPELKRVIDDYDVERYVKIKGLVSHKEAIQIMVRSHLLLLVKATGEGSNGQIPAKYFEYLGTRNKILCIGSEESEVSALIRSLNAGFIIENDESNMFQVLRDLYEKFVQGDIQVIDHPDIRRYTIDHMAEEIKKLLTNNQLVEK